MQKSNDTNNVTPIDPTPEVVEGVVVEEKQSFVHKTKAFVKNHKKPAIAVGALVGLVGVSAFVGRKTAPPIDTLDFDPTPESMEQAELALEELGIPVNHED